MSVFGYLLGEIWQKKSVTRAFYNERLRNESLKGKVIDIGGGNNADYISFMKREEGVSFHTLDIKAGSAIDFEVDNLPSVDDNYDTVLFLNILEHIYNYDHLMSEVVRITKPDGKIIGVVPFLMWYHPDHSDYFRYTHEALERIIDKAGGEVTVMEKLARGPFTAAAQMLMQSLPRLLRPLVFSLLYGLDGIFLFLRPKNGDRYVLGYYFEVVPKKI